MTTEEIVEYYADLLIIQYRSKEKAREMIKIGVRPYIMNQLPTAIENAFSIEDAIGKQLDILGKYVDIPRRVPVFGGYTDLSDDDYRQLIKMKIFQNNSTSALSDIQNLISIFFPEALRVFDYQNMHMSYYFDAEFGSQLLAEAFVRLGLLPKPMGVQLAPLIYIAGIDNVFGYVTDDIPYLINASGYNTDDDYSLEKPWLSDENAILE